MGVKEKIKQLVRERGMSVREFEQLMGFGNGYVSKLDKSSPSSKYINRIANFFDIPVDYLLDDGETIIDVPKKNLIPVLGFVAAGIPITAQENVIGYEEITNDMARRGEWFALVVKGDSMNPRIYEGDIVICREQPDAENGDLVVALINGDEACVKKLIKFDNGIALQSLNPNYPLMTFTEKQIESLPIRIIGKVEELRARL